MRSNFAFHRTIMLIVLIGIWPTKVTSDDPPIVVVMLYDQQKYNDTLGVAFDNAFRHAQTTLDYPMVSHVVDTKGSVTMITRAYFDAEKKWKPHVYMGEKTSEMCRTIATLAASKNRLYISIGGNIEQFAMNRDLFPTFASSGRASHSLAQLVTETMRVYDWTRAAVINDMADIYILRARFVKQAIAASNLTFISYSHAQSNGTQADFDVRLDSVEIMFKYLRNRSNLFILFMSHKESQFLIKYAARIGMMNGENAFMVHALVENWGIDIFDYDGLEGVLTIDRPVFTDTQDWRDFENMIYQEYNSDKDEYAVKTMKMKYAALLYDAVYMLLDVLKDLQVSLKEDADLAGTVKLETIVGNGTKMAEQFQSMRTYGITGLISTTNGMRSANYTLSIIQNGRHRDILKYEEDSGKFTDLKPKGLVWPGGSNIPPVERECFDEPCGTDPMRKLILIVAGSLAGFVVIAVVIVALVMFFLRIKEKEAIVKWRINWDDIHLMEDDTENVTQSNSKEIPEDRNTPSRLHSRTDKIIAVYKGQSVSIKRINRESVDIFENTTYMELKEVLHVKHDNLNLFVGVCVDAPNVCVAMAHAEKGSLRDVLADPKFEIDWEFHMSLALDIVKGMEYLHNSPVGTHGRLTSSNCVIDERWVCKITDYGLKLFRCLDKLQTPLSDLLWIAPELLHRRESDRERVYGTKPGDVYSFGIIISEILTRESPYHDLLPHEKLEELLAKVKLVLDPPFRPTLPMIDEPGASVWIDLAKTSWQTSPHKRPTFRKIRATLSETNSGKFTNVLERMQMVLEDSLGRANAELTVEKRRAESIMQSVVPRPFLQAISDGREVEPQLVKTVTLCQCDTSGLYAATSQLSAAVVVDALKSLYQKYDDIISNYGAFEVSTWGSKDSMMLAGGLSVNSSTDAQGICAMAADLMSFVEAFSHPFVEANVLKIRISIHTGSVYTSVMVTGVPRFCIYGEAVQTTADLHTSTKAMTIRITEPVRERLPQNTIIQLVEAGQVKLKERGLTMTYFITGKLQPHPLKRRSSTRRRSSEGGGHKSKSDLTRHRSSVPSNEADKTVTN